MNRPAVLFGLFLLITRTSFSGEKCVDPMRELSEAKYTKRLKEQSLYALYPFIAPVRWSYLVTDRLQELSDQGELSALSTLALPWHIARKEAKYIGANLLAGLAMAPFFASAFEIMEKSEEFIDVKSFDPVVVVDGTKDERDIIRFGPTYLFHHYWRKHDNLHFLRGLSRTNLQNKLITLAKTHGPIAHMDLVSHGQIGAIRLKYGHFYPPYNFRRSQLMKGVFRPGATIRLFNCSVGRDSEGEAFAQELGEWLLPEGGTLILADQEVAISPGEAWTSLFEVLARRDAPEWMYSTARYFGSAQVFTYLLGRLTEEGRDQSFLENIQTSGIRVIHISPRSI